MALSSTIIHRCSGCGTPIEKVWGVPIDDIPKMADVVEAARPFGDLWSDAYEDGTPKFDSVQKLAYALEALDE